MDRTCSSVSQGCLNLLRSGDSETSLMSWALCHVPWVVPEQLADGCIQSWQLLNPFAELEHGDAVISQLVLLIYQPSLCLVLGGCSPPYSFWCAFLCNLSIPWHTHSHMSPDTPWHQVSSCSWSQTPKVSSLQVPEVSPLQSLLFLSASLLNVQIEKGSMVHSDTSAAHLQPLRRSEFIVESILSSRCWSYILLVCHVVCGHFGEYFGNPTASVDGRVEVWNNDQPSPS